MRGNNLTVSVDALAPYRVGTVMPHDNVLLGMADTKRGRDKKGHDEEKRQRERELDEEREQEQEAESDREREDEQ
ncbi:Uncharacterized protein HSBGL_2293 [Halapricum desulfuricans]|uniref:Uncharacterized protein n=2 Tax=Halapricum desulfuricans TaxID=2841257 RepID=A0A897NPD3_9EURY|nr:Uncharacterized protein HSBGL_2293 [Halapricum desulfuricans]